MIALAGIPLLAASCSAGDSLSTKSYPVESVRKVIVLTDSGSIALIGTIDAPATVQVSPAGAPGDDCQVSQELREGTLRVSAHAPTGAIVGHRRTCGAGFIIAANPQEVTAHSEAGEVTFGMPCRKADISTGSGAIRLLGIIADTTTRTGSGRIGGSGGGIIEATTASGDIHLIGLTGPVKARTESGSISLAWALSPSSGTIEARTESGNIDATFPKNARLRTSLKAPGGRVQNDFSEHAKAAPVFVASSDSGNVTIRKAP